MSSSSSTSIASQVKEIDVKLKNIERKISALREEKQTLLAQKESLQDFYMLEKSKERSSDKWSLSNFPWSANLINVMKSVFKIEELRLLQREAINATMSKEDVILIMPTGGGKSLCYQLPALLSTGVTLVISPLISLMEDQVAALRRLGIDAVMLSATSSKEETKRAGDALQDSSSKVKLLYVTPERLAKSKRFMNQLQKCAASGRFARLAIDEVHCCSTWGHDFRPDYNFLGVLRDMFPKTPIIGVTATSSSKVTIDVQKMLNLEGAVILRAPFNRPNLRYFVLQKPDDKKGCADTLTSWIQGQFRGQSGIIYTTTIKDCEELATDLKKNGVKVGVYHAMLEANNRSRTHERWMEGTIQVVVATIAFGLGIDKPNVRFVIHHALSKSMEMLYQESGRAGRDGKEAYCITLYRLKDVFQLSKMVFTLRTGLENLYGIVQYCLESKRCRRSIFAEYFDEVFDTHECKGMCDLCNSSLSSQQLDAANHCRSIYRLLEHAAGQDKQLTAIKLVDAWLQQGDTKLRLKDMKTPTLSRTNAEVVVALLLCQGYLKEDFHYTAYSTISYLRRGPKASMLDEPKHIILINIPKLPSRLEVAKPKEAVKNTPNEQTRDLSHSNHENERNLGKHKVSSNKVLSTVDEKDVVLLSDEEDDFIVQPSKKKKKNTLFGSDDDGDSD